MTTNCLGSLFLLPVMLGDTEVERYLPPYNIAVMRRLSCFVVENIKTARRCIKKICPEAVIANLEFFEIDKHDNYAFPAEALERLRLGVDVGLMSEAGCPAVADPGSNLVRSVHEIDVPVVPLVGPSSILLALMASGLNGQRFCFQGYLPLEAGNRRKLLDQLLLRARQGETQIFIETPYRNDKLLQELIDTLPPTLRIGVATNLTCANEQILVHTVKTWKQLPKPLLHKQPTVFLIGA